MDKSDVVETVRPVSDSFENHLQGRDPQWQPGFWVRFPWIGFIALFTVLLCVVGSIITLVLSDGASSTHWPEDIAPNVILSGMNNVANFCFAIAIGRSTTFSPSYGWYQ